MNYLEVWSRYANFCGVAHTLKINLSSEILVSFELSVLRLLMESQICLISLKKHFRNKFVLEPNFRLADRLLARTSRELVAGSWEQAGAQQVVVLPCREHDNPARSSSLFRVFIIILYLDGTCSLPYFAPHRQHRFLFYLQLQLQVWITVGPGFDSRLSTVSISDEDNNSRIHRPLTGG